MKLSIVVPCYNEQNNIFNFYDQLTEILNARRDIEYEFLFVDDGSKDNTFSLISDLAEKDGRVKCVSFSRNFGKEAAMLAGLENADGDFVAIMDADLQHPPKILLEMINVAENGNEKGKIDCVAARRVNRDGDPKISAFFAHGFYKIINKISSVKLIDGVGDFRLMRRDMVDALLKLKEKTRFSKGLFSWVGFNTDYVEFENVERASGETKWSLMSLMRYAIEGIVSFSAFPLTVISIIGLIIFLLAIVLSIVFIADHFINNTAPQGYATLMIVILFLGGSQMLAMGIIGQYLSKVFIEVKDRPSYLVRRTIGFPDK